MRGSSAGISDGLRGASPLYQAVLTALDQALASALVTPLVVAYWRATWQLTDELLLPEMPVASAIISLTTGLLVLSLLTLAQHSFTAHPESHRLLYYCLSRSYTAVFALFNVQAWRGAWQLADAVSCEPWPVVGLTVVAAACLAAAKTLRNLSAPPFAVVTDRREGFFDVPTMFKARKGEGWRGVAAFWGDCVFSVCVVGTLVVLVWRGSWTLLDLCLYPENPKTSGWASLVIGYCVVVVSFVSQPLAKWGVRNSSGLGRLAIVDLYLLFSFCGTINVWRGIWMCLNHYFIPHDMKMSCAVSHVSSFLILVLLNSANSILVRGVYIDAEEPADQCVDFPTYYLRLFFQEKRKEKLLKKHIEVLKQGVEADSLLEPGKKVQIVRASNNAAQQTKQAEADSLLQDKADPQVIV